MCRKVQCWRPQLRAECVYKQRVNLEKALIRDSHFGTGDTCNHMQSRFE